jgi:RNA polymerase sigma-70 factor (ECF subfamily)
MFARGEQPAPGDSVAYEALYERYRARLVRYCRRRLWNKADAEDAAHETLLRAFRALSVVDLTGDPWPWLTTIAGRICTDVRRRAARPPLPVALDTGDDVVHEEVVGRLRADILDDALRQLPDHYRTSLLLREYGGWAYDDIALLQGRSVGSVRSLLARSRRRLETQVESVARTRQQWPLPAAVPPVRRLRDQFRAWRDSLERSPNPVLGILELSAITGRLLMGAQIALAAIVPLALATVAVLHPVAGAASASVNPTRPVVAWEIRTADNNNVSAEAAISTHVAHTPATRETLTQLSATAPVPQRYTPGLHAEAGVNVDASTGVLWVEHHHTVTVPGMVDESSTGTTNVTCNKNLVKTLTCDATRQTLEQVPPT